MEKKFTTTTTTTHFVCNI